MSEHRKGWLRSDLDKQLGKVIRARREQIGITQRDLAQAIGVTYQQIAKYETGENRLYISALLLIADALHIPFDDLVRGAIAQIPPPAPDALSGLDQ